MYDKNSGELLANTGLIHTVDLPYFSTYENGNYYLHPDQTFSLDSYKVLNGKNQSIIELKKQKSSLTATTIHLVGKQSEEYPYYSEKITSPDGKYTAGIIIEDEKGHGGINVITDDKVHKRVLSDISYGDWLADKNKKADEGDSLGHRSITFIDNTRFLYLRVGYEWSRGFGIYDAKTNKNVIFEDLRIASLYEDDVFYDGYVYAVSVSRDDYGWYDINTFLKISPDGTKTDLDFREIPNGTVLFRNGYWIIQFDSRAMPDNYGVPKDEYKTFIRVYTANFDKKLLEVSVPNTLNLDTILNNGFITPYNNRIFIPADGSNITENK